MLAQSARECSEETNLVEYTYSLQHTATRTATHCNALQHTATHCNTLQHTATHCNTLQHTATHCNHRHVFAGTQCFCTRLWLTIAVYYSVLQCEQGVESPCCRARFSWLPEVAICCNMLQCVAVCCSVLQRVSLRCTVCCSALQREKCIECDSRNPHFFFLLNLTHLVKFFSIWLRTCCVSSRESNTESTNTSCSVGSGSPSSFSASSMASAISCCTRSLHVKRQVITTMQKRMIYSIVPMTKPINMSPPVTKKSPNTLITLSEIGSSSPPPAHAKSSTVESQDNSSCSMRPPSCRNSMTWLKAR